MKELLYLQMSMSIAITLVGCLFLSLKSDGVRSRRILAWIMGIWTVNFVVRLAGPFLHIYPLAEEVYWSPLFMVVGPFIALLLLWYVIEVVRPGWINGRRGCLIALPWLVLSALYPLVLWLLDEPYVKLTDFDDLLAHITEFNVWYRFILFVMNYVYIYWMNRFALRYRSYYDKWCADNYASTELMDISWVRYLAGGLLVTTILYSCLLFNLGMGVWVIHQVCIQFVLLTAFYFGLYHRNPYAEAFFEQTMDEEEAVHQYEAKRDKHPKEELTFADYLPGYVRQVEQWMREDEPYLKSDFKLLDVGEVIPLNRSYLSRIFNEGFNQSFCQLVQQYRIEKARTMLLTRQELSIKEIVFDCGFSSISAFHTTFREKTGMTPGQYRQQGQATDPLPTQKELRQRG